MCAREPAWGAPPASDIGTPEQTLYNQQLAGMDQKHGQRVPAEERSQCAAMTEKTKGGRWCTKPILHKASYRRYID